MLSTLVGSQDAFRAYVAASPSIWWNREGLLEGVRTLPARLPEGGPGRRVMLSGGEYEESLAPDEVTGAGAASVADRRRSRAMVANCR